jgi:uncharacterized protein (TIGR02246 family)
MPRFSRLFEAAAATFICADGAHLSGLENIRAGLSTQLDTMPVTIEPLDIRVYDSLGTVVYAIAEAHQPTEAGASPAMVFSTYVMVHERGEWRIAHIHASPMADDAAGQLAVKMRHGQGPLH